MATLYTNPLYKWARPDWIRYRDLYEGKHDVLTKTDYLWAHPIELKKDADGASGALRTGREQRTRYLNLVEAIASLWQSYFFRDPYTLGESTKQLLGEAEDDIDGRGTSLFSFMRDKVLLSYLVYGKAIVTVDAFSKTGKNLAEQKELGIRPFMEVIDPLSMVDWDIEVEDTARIGKYNFLRTEYDLIPPRQGFDSQPTVARYSQVLYRANDLYTIATYTTPVDEYGNYTKKDPNTQEAVWDMVGSPIPTQLEEIPVSVIDSKPWLHDVCEETLRHYNLRSNLDNINYFQGYDDKYIKGVTDPAAMKNFGEYIVKFLPSDGDAIKLPPADPASLERACDGALNNTFKVGLNLFRTLPSDSKAVQGADTIQEDKDNTYAIVESTLEEIEVMMTESLRHFAAFKGQKDFEPEITLCKEIKDENWSEFIQIYNAFKTKIEQLPELDKATFGKAIGRLNLPKEDTDAALKELESTELKDPMEELNQQKNAFVKGVIGG